MKLKQILRHFVLFILIFPCAFFAFGAPHKDSLHFSTVLFKITNSTSQKVSYIFGTHHAFGPQFFDSLTNANELLLSCDLVIKENIDMPGHLAEDIINGRKELTKWEKYLSKDNLQYIREMFANSPTDFHKMTPIEMYVFLARYAKEKICLQRDMSLAYLTLDTYIGTKASQKNIPLLGLETTEEQIKLINEDVAQMPKKVHKKRLAKIIDILKNNLQMNCDETDWYRQMNINYQLNQPCQNSLILTNRNHKWMQTLSQQLKTNNCFIVVGLSHLMYQCGLLNQLKESGYTITPVPVK